MATESFWARFGRWRRGRPFWGGLLLLLSGLEMFLSANMALDNIEIHIGPQGFLSYLLPTIMLVCGALTWFTPAQRVFYGIVGTLTALYSFVGLNLGGWIAGMILGIVGGALGIAWGPPRQPPAGKAGRPGPDQVDEPTAEIRPAAGDPGIVPGLKTANASEDNRRPPYRKTLMLIVPLAVAGVLVVADNPPADAAECPEGLPSRTATTVPAKKSATPRPGKSEGKTPAPAGSASATPSPSASAAPGQEGGNPILDGIGDVVDGIGDLLGIGDDEETPAPAPSPSPSSGSPSSGTSSPAAPSRSASRAPSAKPSGSAEEIPCLGPRQEGVVAAADGLPQVALKPGLMKVGSLTMYNSTYEGVTELPTRDGTIQALSFVMDKAVNKPFSLQIDEPGDATTLIRSNELITDGNVEFYTPKMTGKLFGLIPVTFTPEQPPPLTLPVLWFTDVTIDLAYVQCDVLTADPLDITES